MTNVEILKANHFIIEETGGRCTAWIKNFMNGKTVMIGRDSSHQFNTEQGGYVNVESKKNDVQALINFANFLDGMDNLELDILSNFEPFIQI